MTGRIRTNRRTMAYYNRPSSAQAIIELVDTIGIVAASEYLDKYPTVALKAYAAEVKLRELKTSANGKETFAEEVKEAPHPL